MQILGKFMGLILENGCAIEKIFAPNLSPGGLISEKKPKFKPLGLKFRGGLIFSKLRYIGRIPNGPQRPTQYPTNIPYPYQEKFPPTRVINPLQVGDFSQPWQP